MRTIDLLKTAEAFRTLRRFLVVITIAAGCSQQQEGRSTSENATSELREAADDREERKRELTSLLEVDAKEAVHPKALPQFTNVAEALNLRFSRFSDAVPDRYFLPEVMGGGVAWVDFDRDGLLDLYAINGCRVWDEEPSSPDYVNRLYRNTSSGFVDVTSLYGSSGVRFGQGCAVGDFNSDGFEDLYITNYGRNTLLQSNGDGTFDDVTVSANVGCEEWSSSAVWLDANLDGFADLYTVNYLHVTRENHRSCDYVGVEGYCGPGAWDAVDDVLYVNSGDGNFVPAKTIADNLEPANGKGLAVAVADFDGDTVAEVYVANDMVPNYLLKRLDSQHATDSPLFEEVAATSGCAVSFDGRNEASMGVACSDFDGDGLVDIFLTHFYESKNTLYRNLGSLLFEDASRQTRISATSFDKLGFGTVALDADLDGFDEIFIANGHVLGPNLTPNEMTPQLLLNDGAGVFSDVSADVGDYFSQLCLGRGVAGGDFDNDGRLDLAVSHLDVPLALLHNETLTENHFIGLELLPLNRCNPAGCRVIVTTTKGQRIVPVVGGGSYLSSNDSRLLIGLGDSVGPVDVEVHWSKDNSIHYRNLQQDRYWALSETGVSVLRTDNRERK